MKIQIGIEYVAVRQIKLIDNYFGDDNTNIVSFGLHYNIKSVILPSYISFNNNIFSSTKKLSNFNDETSNLNTISNNFK